MNNAYARAAGEIAREAGQFLKHFSDHHRLCVENKGNEYDFVTNADRQSQKLIRDRLAAAFPDHRFVGEEDGLTDAETAKVLLSGDWCWVCDPLDGTINYIHGLGLYAVSIGLVRGGQSLAGAIYVPEFDELFLGARGEGATLNGMPIHTSDCPDLRHAFVSCDLSSAYPERRPENLERMSRMAVAISGTRVLGSACVAISRVACGRQEAYWNWGLHAWDVAAGAVILEEAGGAVSDIFSDPFTFELKNGFLGTCGTLKGAFREVLRP